MTYALPRSAEEYERLRAQARMWEPDTVRLLDAVGLGPGARCLDVGCGPGRGHAADGGASRPGRAGRPAVTGTVEALGDGRWVGLAAGDVFHAPDGARHAFRNAADGPVTMPAIGLAPE